MSLTLHSVAPPARKHQRFRLELEPLEDRSTPSLTVTLLSISPNPVSVGQTYMLSASVKQVEDGTLGFIPGGGDDHATVSFRQTGTEIAKVPVVLDVPNRQGVATFSVTASNPGAHSFTAHYSGEIMVTGVPPGMPQPPIVTNGPSTSSAVALQVNPAVTPVTMRNVAPLVRVTQLLAVSNRTQSVQFVTVHNMSKERIRGPINLVIHSWNRGVRLVNGSGIVKRHGTRGDVFIVSKSNISSGARLTFKLIFYSAAGVRPRYSTMVLAGPGVV